MRRGTTAAFTMAAALILAPAIGASSASPPQSELLAAADAYDRATVGNDTKTLAALVTDDYILINSDSSVQGKASYLADFAVPGLRIETYRIEQRFSRIQDGAALTGGTLQLGWTQDGQRQSRRLRVAHFWVRQDGNWRIGYTQLTRMPE